MLSAHALSSRTQCFSASRADRCAQHIVCVLRRSSSGFLADAGLLVHVFDAWEATNEEWVPDDQRPEIAASLIFGEQRAAMGHHQIPLYPGKNGGTAGLIFRPGITKLLCGKAVDSVGTCHVYGGWCKASRLHMPWTEGQDKLCAWRTKDFGLSLQRLTQYQARYHHLDEMYNEIIVSASWWKQHNPDAIEAIFGDRRAHARFLAAFAHRGVSAATHPYVELDRGNWVSPIR